MSDVIMSQVCQVIAKPGAEPSELIIRFMRPTESELARFEACAEVSCSFFNREIKTFGSDSVQAFASLQHAVLAYLEGRLLRGIHAIFFHEPGDLNFSNFWLYKR
jgi:hypothetical protein